MEIGRSREHILIKDSIIYSFGAGEDVSWDIEMIGKYKVWIHAFDPTPKSIEWVHSQKLPDHFIFYPYGIGQHDEMEIFFVPLKADNVSYSVIPRETKTVKAPVKRLATIMRELKHDHIDILKMNIEGSEYKVIEDILKSHILPTQVLVEFHHRKMQNGAYKIARAIRMLRKAGYKIFYVSPSGDEFSFIYNTAIA